MMSLSEILFLSFIVSAWTAPLTMDIDASSESTEIPEPSLLDDTAINDQKISVTWPQEPIAEILDPHNRGIDAIRQVADKSYQKLLLKTPRLNFQYAPYNFGVAYPIYRKIPVSDVRSIVSVPIILSQRMPPNLNHAFNNDDVWHRVNNLFNFYFKRYQSEGPFIAAQIDPLPVVPSDWVNGYQSSSSVSQSSNNQSIWKPLEDFLKKLANNQNQRVENRMAREVIKNTQNLVYPQIVSGLLSIFTNQDSVESPTASPELSNESSESDENQSGSTMTMSTTEKLLTTLPTEFESTTPTTIETRTEIPTTKSDKEEIIPSATQSELLDKNAEIDEAVAFNIDGGYISSTQERTTQFPKINKDNFYVIYGRPALTKKDNSLLLNANVGKDVAVNKSDINNLKITNVA